MEVGGPMYFKACRTLMGQDMWVGWDRRIRTLAVQFAILLKLKNKLILMILDREGTAHKREVIIALHSVRLKWV